MSDGIGASTSSTTNTQEVQPNTPRAQPGGNANVNRSALRDDGSKQTAEQLRARADVAQDYENATARAVSTVAGATVEDVRNYEVSHFRTPELPQKVSLKQLSTLKTFAATTVFERAASQSSDVRNLVAEGLSSNASRSDKVPMPSFNNETRKLQFDSREDQARAVLSALEDLDGKTNALKESASQFVQFGARLSHGPAFPRLKSLAAKHIMGNQFHAVIVRSAITAIPAAVIGLGAGRIGSAMVGTYYRNNPGAIPEDVLKAASEALVDRGTSNPTEQQVIQEAVAALSKPGSQFVSNDSSQSEIESTDGAVNYLRGIIFPAGDQINLATIEQNRAQSSLSTEHEVPSTRLERAVESAQTRWKTQLVMGGISAVIAGIAQSVAAIQNQQSASKFIASFALNAASTMGAFVSATLIADASAEALTSSDASQLNKELIRTPMRAAMQTIAQTLKTGISYASDSSQSTWPAESLKLIGTGFLGTLGKEGNSSVLAVLSKAAAPQDIKTAAAVVDAQSSLSKLQVLLDAGVAQNSPEIADQVRELERQLGELNLQLSAISMLDAETDRAHLQNLNKHFVASVERQAQILGYLQTPEPLTEVVVDSQTASDGASTGSRAETSASEDGSWDEAFVTDLFQEIMERDDSPDSDVVRIPGQQQLQKDPTEEAVQSFLDGVISRVVESTAPPVAELAPAEPEGREDDRSTEQIAGEIVTGLFEAATLANQSTAVSASSQGQEPSEVVLQIL